MEIILFHWKLFTRLGMYSLFFTFRTIVSNWNVLRRAIKIDSFRLYCLQSKCVNTFDTISFPRIWFLQLHSDDKWRDGNVCPCNGESRNHVHLSGVTVWPQFDIRSEGISRFSWIHGNNFVISHVGLFGWYFGPTSHHSTNATYCLGYIDHLFVCSKLLFIGSASVFERVFVSCIFKAK